LGDADLMRVEMEALESLTNNLKKKGGLVVEKFAADCCCRRHLKIGILAKENREIEW